MEDSSAKISQRRKNLLYVPEGLSVDVQPHMKASVVVISSQMLQGGRLWGGLLAVQSS